MTIGFPDWGRQSHATGVVQETINLLINFLYTGPVFFTGDYGYLDISWDLRTLSDHYQVSIFFYDDAGGLVQPYNTSFVVGPGMFGGFQTPCPSKYAQIEILPALGTDVNFFKLFVRSAATPHLNPWASTLQSPAAAFHSSIAAGGNALITATEMVIGTGWLNIAESVNGLWHVIINGYSLAGPGFVFLAQMFGAQFGTTFAGMIALPPVPIQFELFNDDTVAHTFTLFFGGALR